MDSTPEPTKISHRLIIKQMGVAEHDYRDWPAIRASWTEELDL